VRDVHVPTHVPLVHVTVAPVPAVGQTTQVRPPVPQALVVLPGWQVLFWQQPFGQLAAVHTHEPFLHSWPTGQLMQATPPVPQALFAVPCRHWPFSQQPFGQVAAVHTHSPFWQSVPLGQATQATPSVPQALFAFPCRHWPLSQQPFGQLVGVQILGGPPWHSPATHSIPSAQRLPQLPQCFSFVRRLTQLPPQQVWFSLQWLPQLPQCFSFCSRLTHLPPQQVWFSLQWLPQLPQCFSFVWRSAHLLLHRVFRGSAHRLSLTRLRSVAPATPGKEAIKEPARTPPRSRSARRRESEPLASPRARSSNECCAVESSREGNCPLPFSSTGIGLFLYL
jgi:hypothetical protein